MSNQQANFNTRYNPITKTAPKRWCVRYCRIKVLEEQKNISVYQSVKHQIKFWAYKSTKNEFVMHGIEPNDLVEDPHSLGFSS